MLVDGLIGSDDDDDEEISSLIYTYCYRILYMQCMRYSDGKFRVCVCVCVCVRVMTKSTKENQRKTTSKR